MKNNQINNFFILIFVVSLPIYAFAILAAKGIILSKEAAMLSIPLMALPPIIVAAIFVRKDGESIKQLLKKSFDYKKILFFCLLMKHIPIPTPSFSFLI